MISAFSKSFCFLVNFIDAYLFDNKNVLIFYELKVILC